MVKRYEIADVLVDMDTFGKTSVQAEPYSSVKTGYADITVNCDWRALKEQQPHLSDEECEYLATGDNFYRQLLKFNGMVLHASAVVLDGRAWLFAAASGTGKSTHTKLWCSVFANAGAYILNDDKPAMRLLDDGVVYAYGTPWSGKTDQSRNVRIPVGGICLLHRGQENRIRRSTAKEAIFTLLEQTARPKGERSTGKMLELLDKILARVPVWYLECNMEPEAAYTAYRAMSQQVEEQGL